MLPYHIYDNILYHILVHVADAPCAPCYKKDMTRADVIARLKQTEPALRARGVAHLFLHGSYARDEARADSDIDVLVDFEPGAGQGLSGFLAPMETLEAQFPGTEIGYSTRDSLVPIYRPYIEQSLIQVF